MIVVDVAQDGRHANWVQAGGGLVQYEHGGLHGNNAGDGDPALLSAGQLKGGFFQHVLPQPNKLGGLAHPAVDLPLVQPHVFGAKGDILIDGLLKELVLRVLKHQSHLEAGLAGALLALPDIPALEEDAAGGGLEQPVEVLDEGGFARAGVADDAQVLPAVGGKVHVHQGPVFKGGTGGIDVAQALRLNGFIPLSFGACPQVTPVFAADQRAPGHIPRRSVRPEERPPPPAGAATAARWSRGQ